jgi:hypothetical protein
VSDPADRVGAAAASAGVVIPEDELDAAERQLELLLAAAATVERWCA